VADAPSVGAFEWPLPCALVVGNERFGLDPDVVQACDAVVRIPLAGRKNSLNVVSALAVALFAIRSGKVHECISSLVPYGSTSTIKNKLFPHLKAQRALRFSWGQRTSRQTNVLTH